jgi:hypothetical protein
MLENQFQHKDDTAFKLHTEFFRETGPFIFKLIMNEDIPYFTIPVIQIVLSLAEKDHFCPRSRCTRQQKTVRRPSTRMDLLQVGFSWS